jgi:sugar O-acyltransferase (sialic acid O-acetyltransferase NeuD family)
MATVKRILKTIFIIGGNAGAKIATNIFSLTHSNHSLCYVECFCDEITTNRLFRTVEESLDTLKDENIEYFIATGDNELRKKHYELIKNYTNKEPINCIHPTSLIETSKIGHGNLICPNAVIHIDASIHNCTIINTRAVVEHDCEIKSFSQISPNVTLCGYVSIGESSFIGAGSTIIPKISVGYDSIVAAGSVVIKDVQYCTMVAGVPAKIKKHL